MEHLKDNPDASRTELRQALPGYMLWLYRHDREWLHGHQPEPETKESDCQTRVNWATRDDVLLSRVKAAVERLKMRSDPLIRASATAVGRELGCLKLDAKASGENTEDGGHDHSPGRGPVRLLPAVGCCIPGMVLMMPVSGRSPGNSYERPGSATICPSIQRSYLLIERLGTESGRDEILGASCY